MSEVERIEFSYGRQRTRGSMSESSEQATDSYMLIPYGFQPRSCYKPKAKSKEITGGTERLETLFLAVESVPIFIPLHTSSHSNSTFYRRVVE
jgi:hypothetical protein